VTIWWKKKTTKTVALMVIGVQWLFVALFVAIGFAVHTHPPNEYYANPDPVIIAVAIQHTTDN
jgi:hypothetical protein